ncbi:SSI family serine proteinase inhibitor [Streptomyces sp. NPDC046831]|uniref:SSI family serine proteinase inhibitor n=1 Tax=Streptomyces sp. NPDC046831 TaxID=3154805 RepID=UPI0033F542B0
MSRTGVPGPPCRYGGNDAHHQGDDETGGALPAGLAALLLAAPAPVQAAHRSVDRHDWLYLSVTRGDVRSGDTRGTMLLCDPPEGHARAAEACAQLRAARGDIRAVPHTDGVCSMVYAPVTVHARGQWQGRAVDYTETFANACEMRTRTGKVFALDG